MHPLTLQGAGQSTSRGQQGHAPSKGSRGPSLASLSFCWPQAFLGLWLHHSHLCPCLPMTSSLCVSLRLPHRTSVTGFKVVPQIHDDFLLRRTRSQGPGGAVCVDGRLFFFFLPKLDAFVMEPGKVCIPASEFLPRLSQEWGMTCESGGSLKNKYMMAYIPLTLWPNAEAPVLPGL